MFCVRCGEEVGDALVGGLCHPCYLAEKTFSSLVANVDLEVCVHCGARKRGEIWVSPNGALEPAIQDAVEEATRLERGLQNPRVRVSLTQEDERNYHCAVTVSGVSEGVPFEESRATRARVKGGTCVRCSRYQGGYYEALLQVRAKDRDLSKDELRDVRRIASRTIERIVSEGDPLAYVLRDEDIHGGLDIYFGTTGAARVTGKALTAELGGKTTEHAKMVGQKDGLTLYRVTFLLRLPEYRVGDVIRLGEDAPQLVATVNPKSATVRDLVTGKPRTVARDVLEKAAVYRQEEARDAVVVSRTEGELQVLDPWTYATVTVLRPEPLPEDAPNVRVLRVDGELFALGA